MSELDDPFDVMMSHPFGLAKPAVQLELDLSDPESTAEVPHASTTGGGSREAILGNRPGLGAPLALLVFALVFILRFVHLQQSWDIFIDEITYSRIAESVAQHHTVAFFGVTFFLHLPFVFLEQALFIDAFHIHGSIFAVVFALRTVNVLFAAGTAVFMLRIGTRLGGTAAGLAAAGLFAIDPFVIRFDSRVFLEPSTIFWLLGGYAALFNALERKGRSRLAYSVIAGLAMGIGALSNEMAIPLIVVPLGVCLVFGFPYSRRAMLPAAASFGLLLAAFLLAVAAVGQFHNLISQQVNGILRLVGARQDSGFNKPGAPSFISRVLVHLGGFGAVYAVLGLAIVPAFYFLIRGTRALRLVSLLQLTAYAVISYQILFGTLEEQMFYYVDVPAILIFTLGFVRLMQTRPRSGRVWALSSVSVLVVATLMIVDVITWIEIHTTPDMALVSAITWLDSNVGSGTRVAPLADGAQLLVNNYQVFTTETPKQIRKDQPAYVITSSLQASQGYGFATPTLLRWLRANAYQVFARTGRTYGTVVVWWTGYPSSNDKPPGAPKVNVHLPRYPVGEG
jgi:4-amino-4-deoxy-L-arabinose transferase-like glycosyltransferase